MSQFILTCCSTADLSKEHFNKRDIHYICFHYNMNGQNYNDDLGDTIPFDKFYKMIDEGATPVTSQINSEEYYEFFEPFIKEGKSILHISLSSGLSGSFNSANIAKEEILENYPDAKIKIVDSLGASSGYGLLVDYLADMRDSNATFEEACEWAENNKLDVHHWFFSTDLTSYKRGGRISASAAFIGNTLNICPLLNMDHEGHLIPRKKVRTKKKVYTEIVNKMEEHIQDGLEYTGKCFISQSACLDDAESVVEIIVERFPQLKDKIVINNIGTVIGSHTGPGTVALFFMGDTRID